MNPTQTKQPAGLVPKTAPAAPAQAAKASADRARRAGPPHTAARRLRARNLFDAVAKPFDEWSEPVRSAVSRRWRSRVGACVMLATVIAHGFGAAAQETKAPAQTNAAAAVTALAPTNAAVPTASPAAPTSIAQTNDLAATGSLPPIDGAAQTASPTRLDYAAFRIITDRNIFDPNRSPRRRGGGTRAKPKVTESFSLVGTMSYEKGTFAFFDGTSAGYRKVLKLADAIAGYKVTNITPNYVKLTSGTNQLELRVGMQMRREDEGEWLLASQAEAYASAAAAPNAERPAASGGDDNEVLKRLMRQREESSK